MGVRNVTYAELRTYCRVLLQEPTEQEYLDSALNSFIRIAAEMFYERVRPYRTARFVGFSPNVQNPPVLPPTFVPGGYLWPDECWTLINCAYMDPNTSRFQYVHLLSERDFDLAFDQTSTNLGLIYGWSYDRILFVKGSLDPMPDIRFVFSRSPRLPTLQANGTFLSAEDNAQIDLPPQYHTRLRDFVVCNARMSKGDSTDFDKFMDRFERSITQAQAEFREDGVENKHPQIKVMDDFGGVHQNAFGFGD